MPPFKSTEANHNSSVQETRLQILQDFRANRTRILVATNVLSRGMDIQDVTHVIIYAQPPIALSDKVHLSVSADIRRQAGVPNDDV